MGKAVCKRNSNESDRLMKEFLNDAETFHLTVKQCDMRITIASTVGRNVSDIFHFPFLLIASAAEYR